MASSTDCVGVLANNVADVATVTDVMSGVDPLDSTTIQHEESYELQTDLTTISGKKFGLIKEYMGEGIDEQVKSQILESVETIKKAGGEIVEVSLPSLSLALAVYYILVPAEISSNLSRYDGQRYGFSDPTASDLESSYVLSRTNGFGAEAKRRIMIGTHVLSSGYYDAYYRKAQLVRTKIINEYKQAFKSVEFLIGPTAPTTEVKLGENSADPLQMYLSDVMTVGASLAGIPAIVIPAGLANNLPVGLQIMSEQKSDKKLLQVAYEIQKEFQK
jgi:aspartyl-tRNA(Asn)/glutamyl-tRNA(Gln) amidotransferase subunit A